MSDFLESCYYSLFEAEFTPNIRQKSETIIIKELKEIEFKYFYYHKNRLVGIFAAEILRPHPSQGYDTFHIGFIGYRKSDLCIEQARFIKAHWITQIIQNNKENCDITALIRWFNKPSIKFFKKLGLKIKTISCEIKN